MLLIFLDLMCPGQLENCLNSKDVEEDSKNQILESRRSHYQTVLENHFSNYFSAK